MASDANWETKYFSILSVWGYFVFRFQWERTNVVTGESTITVNWTVTGDVVSGEHRISHKGYYKPLIGEKKLYTGRTETFNVK